HGCDRSEEGRGRHDPCRPRDQHRAERSARLGCSGDGGPRDRVFLRREPGVLARLMPPAARAGEAMPPPLSPGRRNLLGLTREGLESFVTELGSKPFRARQLLNWIYKRGEQHIEAMTDLSKQFRAELAQRAEVRTPEIAEVQNSADGTRKWKLRADAGQA